MPNELSDSEELIIPDELPLLPIRDVVVYPYMILPLFVGREPSIRAVNEALAKDRLIFLAAQKEITDENPNPDTIYSVGTVAMIMRMRKLPDGRVKILVQGLMKGSVLDYVQEKPFFVAKIKQIKEKALTRENVEVEALMRTVKEQLEKVISLGRMLSPDILMVVDDINDAGRLADLVASNLGLKVNEAQEILELFDPQDRLKKVNEILVKELEILAMQARIRSQARDEMTKSQREYFLREQIRAIKTELGDTESKTEEIGELRAKIEAAKMPEEVNEEALKQVGRLERMHQDASEATIVRTYLDWLIDIPWNRFSEDNLDLNEAQRVLDEDHYNLKKVKERILEFLAVRKLKKKMKGPILCFVGPPGVGKTSLGKSIARAMGRKFVRISLGGIRDEADVRGHRRTYVGAMPGRVIQGLKQAGSTNPIFMLDEIDKLGSDFRGDPASALLEVLDPEQNWSFRDHYVNLPFNLSHVMFIATAN
ncbi:MAG: LON peptidase substrate-binding domain-containing protein, partial [Deltaproteobacteria bacterium]|nr:LON peptidase substrate-binding domain-containing protein [Deltaproteobacteria bacterium]